MLKRIWFLGLLIVVATESSQLFSQTAICGGTGSGGPTLILPSTSNVNLRVIYAYFPSGGQSGTETIPSFANTAAEHLEDYYDEMSYNTHHLDVTVFDPNGGAAFEADNALSYYFGGATSSGIRALNTEILDKAWSEDNTVFNNVDAVMIFYGGNVFSGGTGVAILSHNSTHYSGCGAILEWGWVCCGLEESVHQWNLAHEYGHLLSTDGTTTRQLKDQFSNQPSGIYNIMHNVYFNGTQPMAAFTLIYLGWIQSSWIKEIDPAQSGDQSQTVTIKDTRLAPLGGNDNVVRIKIPGGATNEHFIVESRQGTGSDVYLSSGGKGLIIWHLNKSYGTYNNIGSMDVEIATAIGANGEDWLDNGVGSGEDRGFTTDFFNASNKPDFAPWTNPNTETGYVYFLSHSFTDLALMDISSPGSSMTFDFSENSPPGPPQNLQISNAGQDGQNVILTWNANSEPDLDHYAIYRGYQDDKFSPVYWISFPVTTTTNTTWTDGFVVINKSAPSSVHYRITAVDNASNASDYSNSVSTKSYSVPKGPPPELPHEIALHQNHPNPFNPETSIRFALPDKAHVRLIIYNLRGEKVRTLLDERRESGTHTILWNGKNEAGETVPSGIYVYRIDVDLPNTLSDFTAVKKMTLLR